MYMYTYIYLSIFVSIYRSIYLSKAISVSIYFIYICIYKRLRLGSRRAALTGAILCIPGCRLCYQLEVCAAGGSLPDPGG